MYKTTLWIMATIGGVIGGWLPTLFGVSDLSGWTILWGTIGGLVGVWAAYRFMR